MADSWLKSVTRWFGGAPPDPQETARRARVRDFHAAVMQAIAAGTRDALEPLRQPPPDLPEEEVELELEMVQGALDALDLRERLARDGLPVLAHQHKALGDEPCHFLASAFLADNDGHRTGRLFLTNRRLFFMATPVLALPWSRVAALEDDERDLVIKTVGGAGEIYRFRCNSFSDARCGRVIADALRRPSAAAPPAGSGTGTGSGTGAGTA